MQEATPKMNQVAREWNNIKANFIKMVENVEGKLQCITGKLRKKREKAVK